MLPAYEKPIVTRLHPYDIWPCALYGFTLTLTKELVQLNINKN